MKTNINKILRDNPVNCTRGAPLGQCNTIGGLNKLHIQKVNIHSDYSPDGTYWGNSIIGIYCAFNETDTRIYIRAKSRDEAKCFLRIQHDGITFKR
jgi:hypothetical protein